MSPEGGARSGCDDREATRKYRSLVFGMPNYVSREEKLVYDDYARTLQSLLSIYLMWREQKLLVLEPHWPQRVEQHIARE